MEKWEEFFDRCIHEISQETIILDLGGGNPFQKEMSKYKELFKGKNYYSLDFNPKFKPNVVGDIHKLPFKDGSADAIICKAVLEHVAEPHLAVNEIYRVLKKNGKVFVYVPFLYPYHGNGYKDYYRFSIDGINYLFRNFSEINVVNVRGMFGTLSLMFPKIGNKLESLGNTIDRFIGKNNQIISGYNIFGVK